MGVFRESLRLILKVRQRQVLGRLVCFHVVDEVIAVDQISWTRIRAVGLAFASPGRGTVDPREVETSLRSHEPPADLGRLLDIQVPPYICAVSHRTSSAA